MQYLKPVVFVLLFPALLQAQHDPHRNAVRLVAKGQFKRAARTLQKARAGDLETNYVLCLSALRQGKIQEAVAQAEKALQGGFPFDRFVAGPRELLKPLYSTDAYRRWEKKYQPSSLLHGPMLGRLTDRSVGIWLRTAKPATVVAYAQRNGRVVASSKPVKTTQRQQRVAKLTLNGLKPETNYGYSIAIDGRYVVTDSPVTTYPRQGQAGKFIVCFGGGAGYVPKWEYMWDTIAKQKPAALLMLGDNVYIDDPTHALTNRYCYYRRQTRPEWRRLTAGTSVYAIYDDHDFGLNDCVPGPEIESPRWKRRVWRTFRNNWINPAYGGGPKQPGCWFDFYMGNVHVIMLDGRYYRTRKPASKRSMLGPVQLAWLKKTLNSSRGVFKVIASPVPWSAGVKPGSKDTWDGFAAERESIFSFLEQNRIEGVFLIAADRHRTDLRVTKRPQGYDLYEFESSKLTNRHTHKVVRTPGLIWGYNRTCTFGLMRFDTKAADPTVQFDCMTIAGKRVHSYTLKRSQLK